MNGIIGNKMKRKTLDTNMQEIQVTNKLSERLSVIKGLGKPIPDYFIDELAENLRIWSDKETSLRIKDFFVENRIAMQVFYDLKERSKNLQEEYEFALAKIASRREIGAMTGKFHPIATRMMPRYDDEWTENEKKLEEIKKISQANQVNAGGFVVVLPEVPNSPLVPKMKDENE